MNDQRFMTLGNDLRFIKEVDMEKDVIDKDRVDLASEFIAGEIAELEAKQEATSFDSTKLAIKDKLTGYRLAKSVIDYSLNFIRD